MSGQQDAYRELNELRKKTGKAKYRTQSDHAKDLDKLTAYTYMFDPMGPLTEMQNRGQVVKGKILFMRDPTKKQFCLAVIDMHILGLERQMARWQGQDQIMYDDDMTPGRRVIYGETDRIDMPGLDDL